LPLKIGPKHINSSPIFSHFYESIGCCVKVNSIVFFGTKKGRKSKGVFSIDQPNFLKIRQVTKAKHTDDVRDQLSLEQDLVPEHGLVVVQRVVQVRDGPVVELVEHADVIDQRLQGLQDGGKLEKSVDDDVENGDEPKANVAEVSRQRLNLGKIVLILIFAIR